MNNLNIIIGREVKERVAKKSFIFTTLLTPLFMILLMALPSLIMLFSHGSKQKIVTIDKSELVLPALLKEAQDNELVAIVPAKSGATQQELINDEDYDGVLVIGPDIVSNPSNVTLYSRESSTMDVKDAVSSTVAEVVREQRMKKYNVEDIDRLLADSRVSVDIKEVRVDEEGNESDSSSTLAMALGFIMTFMLYTFLLLYGQMVMNSIIEEKNNRVLELLLCAPASWRLQRRLDRNADRYLHILQCGLRGLYIRIPGSVHGGRLPVLRLHLRGHRRQRRQRPGCFQPYDLRHHSNHIRTGVRHDGIPGSQLHSRDMDVDDSVHVANGDDSPNTVRHRAVADMALVRNPDSLVRGHGLVRRQGVPHRHLHVRQETYRQGHNTLGPLQIKALT